jgi:hypothetical protein
VGGVGRKSRGDHRALAYIGSGGFLPIYGIDLDRAAEALGEVDPDRPVLNFCQLKLNQLY